MASISHVPSDLDSGEQLISMIDTLLPGEMLELDGRVLGVISHTPAFFDGKTLRVEDRRLYASIDAMLASGSARTLADAVKKLDLSGLVKGDGNNPQWRRTRLIENYKADRARKESTA